MSQLVLRGWARAAASRAEIPDARGLDPARHLMPNGAESFEARATWFVGLTSEGPIYVYLYVCIYKERERELDR